MSKTIKYSVILGAVLSLSFCQGRKSSIFDPTNGENRSTAEQYVTAQPGTASLPSRTQQYTYNFTNEDYMHCEQEYRNIQANGGAFTDFCQQFMDAELRSMGYHQYSQTPSEVQVYFGQPGQSGSLPPYGFAWRDWEANNPQYVNGFNQAYPGYAPPMSMSSLCGDPTQYTNITYASPCGSELSAYYGTFVLQGNRGYYEMAHNGNPSIAQGVYGPSGSIYGAMPGFYQGATGFYQGTLNRNITEENKTLQQNAQLTWDNLKATPQNGLYRLEIVGENIAQSFADRILSTIEAKGSQIVNNNAVVNGYNNAVTNNNYAMASYYYNHSSMAPMTTGLMVAATNPSLPCPPEQYHWVVGDTSSSESTQVQTNCQ